MKKLLYHTLGYPSDLYTERNFALPELRALREVYDEIILLPSSDLGHKYAYEQELPEGVTVDWTIAHDSVVHSHILRLPYLFHPFAIGSMTDMIGDARTPMQFASGFMEAATTLRVTSLLENVTDKHSMTPENSTFYSLWLAGAFNGMARFSRQNGWRMFARAHGFDIRNAPEDYRSNRLRDKLLHGVKKVFLISDRARAGVCGLFPQHSDRFQTLRLGSTRLFPPKTEPQIKRNPDNIRLFTSARFVRLKRLPETLEILCMAADLLPHKRIEWTIFGDGEEMPLFRARLQSAERPNLKVNLAGMTDNTSIQEKLAAGEFDWFILLSSTEGIPVSLGEAMSYSIPSIITDVGQVTELAGPDTSIIIEPEIKDINGIAGRIARALGDSELQKRLGDQSLSTWERSFNADIQAKQLANLLAIPADS